MAVNLHHYNDSGNTPLPADAEAFSLLPSPKLRASMTLTPTPVPIPIATISICTGKASVKAFSACSIPRDIR